MHWRALLHRDIKPANIVQKSKSKDCLDIKLTDFGFASFFDPK